MVYAQTKFCPWKWNPMNSLGFWDPHGSFNPIQTAWLSGNYQEEKNSTFHLADFTIVADHSEIKMRWKDKQNWNIKLTVILIVVGSLEMIPNGLEITRRIEC